LPFSPAKLGSERITITVLIIAFCIESSFVASLKIAIFHGVLAFIKQVASQLTTGQVSGFKPRLHSNFLVQ
jgi:hypothetical protein